MKLKLILLLLSALLLQPLMAQEQSNIEFSKDILRNNIKLSEKSGKLLFIDCYASWHEPCLVMQQEVFTNEEVARFMNENFICMSLDMEKISTPKEQFEGLSVAKKYKISAYPTYLILGSRGIELGRFIGACSASEFLVQLKGVLEREL